jgi:hypothetical protein
MKSFRLTSAASLALVVIGLMPERARAAGGPTWTPGLGLVELTPEAKESAGAPSKEAAAPAATAVPSSATRGAGVQAFGGLATVAGQEGIFPVVGGSARFEPRHLRSLFAPWVQGSFAVLLPSSDSDLSIFDIALRGGMDLHPARLSLVGLGPFIGYRQLVFDAKSTTSLQGLDVGGQVHLRTNEAVGDDGVEAPSFDGTVYAFLQGAGFSSNDNRIFAGLTGSYGNALRLYASFEGCLSDAATCFPHQVRATAGLGGVW